MRTRRTQEVTQGAGTRNRDRAHTPEQAGSIPAPATTASPEIVSIHTGEITDTLSFMERLRDLDSSIALADHTIGTLKEDLKTARRHREGLVTELRATARGERALPLEPSPTKE